jgi:hypothetical protein
MLRPELVRRNPVPLSSDGCTAFGVDNKQEHDQVITGNAVLIIVGNSRSNAKFDKTCNSKICS